MNFLNQLWLDIQSLFLLMGKLGVARPIQWLVWNRNLVKKFSNQMKPMESFQEQSKIYGNSIFD